MKNLKNVDVTFYKKREINFCRKEPRGLESVKPLKVSSTELSVSFLNKFYKINFIWYYKNPLLTLQLRI
jgi:hypothetical protein